MKKTIALAALALIVLFFMLLGVNAYLNRVQETPDTSSTEQSSGSTVREDTPPVETSIDTSSFRTYGNQEVSVSIPENWSIEQTTTTSSLRYIVRSPSDFDPAPATITIDYGLNGAYIPQPPAEPLQKGIGTISGAATEMYTGRVVIPDLVGRTEKPNYLQQRIQIGSTNQYTFMITEQYYSETRNEELDTLLEQVTSTIRIP